MSIFYPQYRFHRVWEISPQWLAQRKISVLLLDVDNTLTPHNNPIVPHEVSNWIDQMKHAGIHLLIISNNKPQRVEPFAQKIGLGCIAHAAKPLTGGVYRALDRLGVQKSQTAMVGDQIFTDILCGNFANITTILVDPIEQEKFLFFKGKRAVERILLRAWQKGGHNG